MKTDNGSHGEQSSGSRSEAKLSARTYGELQRQLHKDLLAQHPEWIDADGNCPTCDDYERRLAQLISIFKSQAKLVGSKSQPEKRSRTRMKLIVNSLIKLGILKKDLKITERNET